MKVTVVILQCENTLAVKLLLIVCSVDCFVLARLHERIFLGSKIMKLKTGQDDICTIVYNSRFSSEITMQIILRKVMKLLAKTR